MLLKAITKLVKIGGTCSPLVLKLLIGAYISTRTLSQQFDDEKHHKNKNRHWYVQLLKLEQRLAQWWHPVAYSKSPDRLHWAMCAVPYQRIAMAIKTTSKVDVDVFFPCQLFACRPGSRWGDTVSIFPMAVSRGIYLVRPWICYIG